MSVGGWFVQFGGVDSIIDISGTPFFTSDSWLVWDSRIGVLVQPYVVGAYHVELIGFVLIPYLDVYLVLPTLYDEDDN